MLVNERLQITFYIFKKLLFKKCSFAFNLWQGFHREIPGGQHHDCNVSERAAFLAVRH
jgi:hypothetical protein